MIPEIRISIPWLLVFAAALVPLYLMAPQQIILIVWALVQICFAVVTGLIIIGQINRDSIPLHFGNLESAILIAALVIAVRLGF